MRRIIFSLLLLCSMGIQAKELDSNTEMEVNNFTPLQVSLIFDEQNTLPTDIPDLADREDKIGRCVEDYVKKQSRTYAKIVQNNLYDLIHNFDRIMSEVYGKKPSPDQISYDEKIEALANVQCEAYYQMGVLK